MKPGSSSHIVPSRSQRVSRYAVRAAAFALAIGSVTYAARSAAQMPGAAAQARYAIQLHRPAAVGRRGRVTVEGEKHQTMRVQANGQVVRSQQEDTRVHFRAVERVMTIDPHGKPLRSDYTIERLETDDTSGTHTLLRPGQVVSLVRVARGAGEPQVTVGGAPVDAPTRSALDVVLSMTAGGVTDDDIFGTSQPQAVGATWPMHADVAQRDLMGTTGIQGTLSGQTRLVSHTTFQGVDALEFSAEMNGTLTSMPNLPPGSVVRTGTLTATNHSMVPMLATRPAMSESTRMTMTIVVDIPPDPSGTRAQIQVSMQEQKDETFAQL